MKNLFTIGEVAKLFNINIQSLHFYDRIGLVKPEVKDPHNGYRLYSTRQFERLNTVIYLRALNMPIKDIQRFFENKNVPSMINLLEKQKEAVSSQKAALDIIEQKIDHRLNDLQDALHSEMDVIIEKNLAPRTVALLKKDISVFDDLEYPLRTLERNDDLKAAVFLGKVGVSVAANKIQEHIFDGFSAVFIMLENEEKNSQKSAIIPGGLYLTLRFCGTHRESSAAYLKLLSYMEEHQYQMIGDALEITMIDAGLTNDTSKYMTELQIPVKKS